MASSNDDDLLSPSNSFNPGRSLSIDPRLRLRKYNWPVGDDEKPLPEFDAAKVLALMQDDDVTPTGSLDTAIARALATRFFNEAAGRTKLISTSEVSLAAVDDLASKWFHELQEAVVQANTSKYELLDQLWWRIVEGMQSLCQPTAPQIKAHIATHKPQDKYDDYVGWIQAKSYGYEAAVQLSAHKRPVEFCYYQETPLTDALLQFMRDSACNLRELDSQAKQIVCAEMLSKYNHGWRDSDQPELTSEEFIERLSLNSVCFQNAEELEVWYFDDGMFGDHSLFVYGGGVGKLRGCSLYG